MTIMFCALDGPPMIVRLYGDARVIHTHDAEWNSLIQHFNPLPGMRQIFDLKVDLVQTSCGMGVPLYDYLGDRNDLNVWAQKKGEQGINDYWEQKNSLSIDGKPINIIED